VVLFFVEAGCGDPAEDIPRDVVKLPASFGRQSTEDGGPSLGSGVV